jgi:hypothetical protein
MIWERHHGAYYATVMKKNTPDERLKEKRARKRLCCAVDIWVKGKPETV